MSYSTYKVIKIIDEYSLLINGGLQDGLSKNDNIEIYLEGEQITDPYEDNKVLGTLDFIKDTLTITEIYEEFAVCKKQVERTYYNQSPMQQAQAAMRQASLAAFGTSTPQTVIEDEELFIERNEITGRITGDKKIFIGDSARISVQ